MCFVPSVLRSTFNAKTFSASHSFGLDNFANQTRANVPVASRKSLNGAQREAELTRPKSLDQLEVLAFEVLVRLANPFLAGVSCDLSWGEHALLTAILP